MKSVIFPILSCIWLFVVFVPSSLLVFGLEEVSFISISLADEDPEEQKNNDFDEETVLQDFSHLKSFTKTLNTLFIIPSKSVFFGVHILEVFLPPPE
ncbi:hypothetical protein [Eudoraea chungangensis]|uniref:hypothetical protein n=1 Tax=Eudoraea chungangensis TaxID=1481905 RepID=UPI0023EDB08C|nr:hypothetical protein [Eudoraea chungangensis]